MTMGWRPRSTVPGKVSAQVADHVPVELTSRTDYPFGEAIDIDVELASLRTVSSFLPHSGLVQESPPRS